MYRKEGFRVRFLGLSAEIEEKIRSVMPVAERKKHKTSLVPVTNTLIFDLDHGTDLTRLCSLLDSLNLRPDQYDVWGTLVTSSDNDGIDVPDYVLRFIRRTNCKVGFSFVNIGPDDDRDDNGEDQPSRPEGDDQEHETGEGESHRLR